MEFRVLGPVEVWTDGARLPLAAAKQQALLAVGLLNARRVVSVDLIVDAIWADPPATAPALVQSYVSALRRLLHRPGQPDLIMTQPPGYRFAVEHHQSDLHRFETLLVEGRAAAAAGAFVDAADTLRDALALWRGPALDGLGSHSLRAQAVRLDEARLAAQEERIAADLELGREAALVPELRGLVAAQPLRERLRGQLMVALYRLGRQADALRLYREGAEVLCDELGLDPSAELRRLHEAILRNDDALLAPASPRCESLEGSPTAATRSATTPSDTPATVPLIAPSAAPSGMAAQRPDADAYAERAVRPSQLSAAIGDLTGREAEVAQLRQALSSQSAAVCAVSGKAGSGKSALAVYVANAVREEYPDGQLYASLRGTSPESAADPGSVLGGFLRALAVEAAEVPDGIEERTGLYRSLLAGRRVLVVLDDAGSARQVRPLLPSQGGSAALITSRASLFGLEGAVQLRLDVLDSESAVRLLCAVAGRARVAAQPDAASEIARLCGFLPLALRTAAARLAAREHWPLAVLAARLRDEQRRLDELAVGDLEVRASLELSYRGLEPAQQRAFRLLGVLAPPDFAPWVLAPLLDVPRARAEHLVEQLADAQLLDFVGAADGELRYRMHDLIRVYAQERGAVEEPAAEQRAAVDRVIRCWLGLLDRAAAGMPIGLPSVRRPAVSDGDLISEGLLANPAAWLAGARGALVAAVERASALGLDVAACELAAALTSSVFRLHNNFDEWWRTHDVALAAARRAGNRRGEAMLLTGLGQLRYEQDRFAESNPYFHEALAACRETGDAAGEATALAGLGAVCREQGHFAESLGFLERARAGFEALADNNGIAMTAYDTGVVHRETGHFPEALAAFEAALAIYRATGVRRGEGLSLRAIGLVHRAAGELAYAAELFSQAIEAFREVGDRLAEAYGVQALAKVHIRQDRGAQAVTPLLECLAVCRELQDRFGEALMLRTLGELELAAGAVGPASAYLVDALARWDELGQPAFRARTLRDLADLHDLRGDPVAAHAARTEAIEIFRTLGSREYFELRPAHNIEAGAPSA